MAIKRGDLLLCNFVSLSLTAVAIGDESQGMIEVAFMGGTRSITVSDTQPGTGGTFPGVEGSYLDGP